jgi:hypothetical protein
MMPRKTSTKLCVHEFGFSTVIHLLNVLIPNPTCRKWVLGEVYCKLNSFSSCVTVSANVFTLLALSLNRSTEHRHINVKFQLLWRIIFGQKERA